MKCKCITVSVYSLSTGSTVRGNGSPYTNYHMVDGHEAAEGSGREVEGEGGAEGVCWPQPSPHSTTHTTLQYSRR